MMDITAKYIRICEPVSRSHRLPALTTTRRNRDMAELSYRHEMWLAIPGWDGFYEVSNFGRVRSHAREIQRRGHTYRKPSTILRPRLNNGYLIVSLVDRDRSPAATTRTVHRLVCEAFHGPHKPGNVAAHLDGVKTNNSPENLAWVTQSVNLSHRVEHGTMPLGESHYRSVLTNSDVVGIRASDLSCAKMAKIYGVSPATIADVKTGRTWAHIP